MSPAHQPVPAHAPTARRPRPVRRVLLVVAALVAAALAASGPAAPAVAQAPFHGSTGGTSLNAPIVGMAPTPTGAGYWLVASDGGIFAFGDAGFFGSTGAMRLNAPIVGMAASAHGYWLVARDGGVFAFGDAAFHGSPAPTIGSATAVGLVPTATRGGYWVVASDGRVWAYGDATATTTRSGGHAPTSAVVGFAPRPNGDGFWTVTGNGAVASYGGAVHRGDVEGTALARPIVGISATPSGEGYWLVASDGGIFAFGDAPFLGSTGGWPLNRPIVGMAPTLDASGYWLVASDGGIFAFPYSGPPPVPPTTGPSIAGCPVLPADSAWNQRVDGLAVHPRSQAWVNRLGATNRAHPDFGANWNGGPFGIPYIVVGPEQPDVPVTFTSWPGESDPGPYPIPLDAPIEGGGDRHVLAIDSGTCRLYEMFAATSTPTGWRAANGAVWDLRNGGERPRGWTSADAAGLPIFPGLARYDEVAAGSIDHALRVTVSCSYDGYVLPATHAAGGSDLNCPPMGARLRLRADRIDPANYTGQSRVIVQAMLTYGLIVADNGSSWYVSGAPDARWSDQDLNQIKGLRGNDFEFVYTGETIPG
jgi:hypothetical protein